MIKYFDQVETLVSNKFYGSPIYLEFNQGKAEVKVKPTKYILPSSRTIPTEHLNNLNGIFYIQDGQIKKLTEDQYTVNDDGTIMITDDTIADNTVFLTNFPKVHLIFGSNDPQEAVFEKCIPTNDKDFYLLSADINNSDSFISYQYQLTGYPGTALKYSAQMLNGTILKPHIVELVGGPIVNPYIEKNTVVITEEWWNNNPKPFTLNYDYQGGVGTYYRWHGLVIDKFSSNKINLDFLNSMINIENLGNNTSNYSSVFEINANYYGTISNLHFKATPPANKKSPYFKILIGNVIDYYGSSAKDLVFENCVFEILFNYRYLFYLNGSNLIFNNCTFKLVKNRVNAYANTGQYKLNNCKILVKGVDF
jgi:hypothetical protein